MNVPAITQREALTGLALPLAAVFVVAVGYGVVLLFMLARASVAWHTSLLWLGAVANLRVSNILKEVTHE